MIPFFFISPVGKSWTIQAWVKPSAGTTSSQVLRKIAVSNEETNIVSIFQEGDDIRARIETLTATLNLVEENVLVEEEWTHILFSLDGITQTAYLYIDDKLVESLDATTADYDATDEMSFITGGRWGLPNANYLGAIDNVRMYAETVGSGF